MRSLIILFIVSLTAIHSIAQEETKRALNLTALKTKKSTTLKEGKYYVIGIKDYENNKVSKCRGRLKIDSDSTIRVGDNSFKLLDIAYVKGTDKMRLISAAAVGAIGVTSSIFGVQQIENSVYDLPLIGIFITSVGIAATTVSAVFFATLGKKRWINPQQYRLDIITL